MKKITLYLLIASSMVFGQISLADTMAPPPIQSPTATPDDGTIFVASLDVIFDSKNKYRIFYDDDYLNTSTIPILEFSDPREPIYLDRTTNFRAVACEDGAADLSGCSAIKIYHYIKDEPPTVSLKNLVANQIIRQGSALTLSVTVASDPVAGGAISIVRYFHEATATGTVTEIGSSSNASSFNFVWTPGSETGNYSIYAKATDEHGAIGRSANVAVRLTPPNQTPTISIVAPLNGASYTGPATITLKSSADDPDNLGGGISKVEYYLGPNLIASSSTGPNYSYTHSSLNAGSYQFTAKVFDNNTPPAIGESEPINITVQNNQAPTVEVTSPTPGKFFYAPANFTIFASAEDKDAGGSITKVEFYSGANLLGTGTALSPGVYSFEVTNLGDGPYSIKAKAFDNAGASTISNSIAITVATNVKPAVNAGGTATINLPTNTLTLNGTANDPELSAMTYSWTGPDVVTFSDNTSLKPKATFPSIAGTYTLTLSAEDSGSPQETGTANITVTVLPPPLNDPPEVNAGNPVTITLPKNTVSLSGTAIDPENQAMTYLWTGPSDVSFSITNNLNSIVTLPSVAGTYKLILSATDTGLPPKTGTGEITITILPPPINRPPIVSAGSNTAITLPTNSVLLNGTATDPENTTMTYLWTGSPGVEFLDNTSLSTKATFPSVRGTYTISLKATDAGTPAGRPPESATASIIVTISSMPVNNQPNVYAGKDTLFSLPKNTLQLSGTASDPEGTPMSYLWTGTGGVTFTSATTPNSIAIFPSAGNYTLTLKATDSGTPAGLPPTSATSSITVTVLPEPVNVPPTVKAGNDTSITLPNNSIKANGTASDPENTPLSYQWTGSAGITFTNPNSQSTTVTFPSVEGIYTLTLKATDSGTPSGGTPKSTTASFAVTINPLPINVPPTVKAGKDTALTLPNNMLQLKGTASDPENTPMVYSWSGTGGVIFTAAASLISTANFPTVGTYILTLKATDSGTPAKSATSQFTVKIYSKPDIKSEPTASGSALQLFVYRPTATGSPAPLFEANPLPPWLTLDLLDGTQALSGTPTNVGTYNITLTARNLGGSATMNLAITIKEAQSVPKITSDSTASGAALQQFSYTIAASGNPIPTLSATSLPSWLTLTGGNVISGKPPVKGNYPVTLTATNINGVDSKVLNITVGDSLVKPTITSWPYHTVKLGTVMTYKIGTTGTSPISFSIPILPIGLKLEGSTITGSPANFGIHKIEITATNPIGKDVKTLELTVNADPKLTTDLPDSMIVDDKSKATFTINAKGYPTVTYAWEYAGTDNIFRPIGKNSQTYIIDSVSASSAGKYRVIVKNGVGPNAMSKSCRLIIKALPKPITFNPGGQPVPLTLIVGKVATFRVSVSGEPPLFYQWYKGSTPFKPAPVINDSVLNIGPLKETDGGLFKVVVTNNYTIPTNPSTYATSDTARLSVQLPKLPKPKADHPSPYFFSDPINVILTNDTAFTSIYYTTDGSTPTQSSSGYINPIAISANKTIKAVSYKAGYRASDVDSFTYSYTPKGMVAQPSILPANGNFKIAMLCSLTTVPKDAEILYTTDGLNPLGPTGKPYIQPFEINATTTIFAIARKNGLVTSTISNKTYTLEKTISKVQTPVANPPGGNFNLQRNVTVSSPTDSAIVYYTTDGTKPDPSSPRLPFPAGGLILKKTTLLRAIATRKGWNNSDDTAWKFNLVPTIAASPTSGSIFDGDTLVNLSVSPPEAKIHFTTDGTVPVDTSAVFPENGLNINETTTLTAIANLDGVNSPAYVFSYTKKGGQLATPSILTSGSASTFKDSIKITIAATVGSTIYFTTNGDLPTTSSDEFINSFWIDSTTTVQAMAVRDGFLPSRILFANYVLIPEAPVMLPSGGSYVSAQKVTMTCTSKRAKIFYTLDGAEPDPANRIPYNAGDTIPIMTSKVLKAVAVAGNMASEVKSEPYTIFGVRDTVIYPGDTYFVEGGYTISNPEDQSARVRLLLTSADSLKIKGFDGVQYAVNLSLSANQIYTPVLFPNLTLTQQRAEKRSLYKIEPNGGVYFVSGSDTVTVNQPGLYFMGIDISPPVITYLNESFDALDSTMVSFRIEDNVMNLTFDLKRNDNPIKNLNQNSLFSPVNYAVKLKHPAGTLKSLEVQLRVSDYNLTSTFPANSPSFHSLSQSLGKLSGPDVWGIGKNSNAPYDFISIPLALNPPLTLADLEKTKPAMTLKAVAWSEKESQYKDLPQSEVLKPGQAYWVASRTKLSALNLTGAKTSARKPGKFTIKLKKGWNQIANPHLEKLYWPVSWNFQEAYRASPIKGLWAYTHQ